MASLELKSVKHKSNENKRDEPRLLTQEFDLHAFDAHINLTYSNSPGHHQNWLYGDVMRMATWRPKVGKLYKASSELFSWLKSSPFLQDFAQNTIEQ